jgi:hypothetical protein
VQETEPEEEPTATEPEMGQLNALVEGVDWGNGQLGSLP